MGPDWGIVFDVTYVDLDGEFGPNDSVDVDPKDAMVAEAVFKAFSQAKWKHVVTC